MGTPAKLWRLRVSWAWIWGTLLGTLAFAPLFGGFVGLVGMLASGDWRVDIGIAAGAVAGLMVGVLWVAAPAVVLAPATAMVMTRSNTNVDSPLYSRRVRRAVGAVMGVASLPLTLVMTRGLNRPLVGVALATFPLFVVAACLTVGLVPVMYTREVFDPLTARDPSVVRRAKRVRAETRFAAMRPRLAALLASDIPDRDIAAIVSYETRLDYEPALQRVLELRHGDAKPAPGVE